MSEPHLTWIFRTPEQIERDVATTLTSARGAREAIIAIPDSRRTFENTIGALERADDALSDLAQQLELLISVHPESVIRVAAQRFANRIDEETVHMSYDPRLWSAVQMWMANNEELNETDRKLADDTIRDMRRMGFSLEPAAFEELKQNTARLHTLETAFEKAIADWEDSMVVTREQLTGLPERYISGLQRSGSGYRISLEYPDFIPFMQLAEDVAARRTLAAKDLKKGGPNNLERLVEMLKLRQRNSQLLGYASHADFAEEVRMSKNAGTVKRFLHNIIEKLIPHARREKEELEVLRKKTPGTAGGTNIGYSDLSYWSNRLLKEWYAIDSEEVKEYFPTEHVVQAMLDIYQQVLGVTFRVQSDRLWHEDAILYEITSNGQLLGHFAIDLFPREGKYDHAATFPVILGRKDANGTSVPGMVVLVCNFPKPSSAVPSLLSHDDMETLLHEFGHVMHALLSGGTWQSQNGFGVPQDFVEAPSQLFEEWAWDPSVLARLTSHFRTRAAMPESLVRQLIASRHHMIASYYLNIAVKALYDIQIHSQSGDASVTASELARLHRDMRLEYEEVELPDDAIFAAGWSHMADYDAGYYSYLWSKVYASDMYTLFAKNPLDPVIGTKYRREVLAPGASMAVLLLVRTFLGREPSDLPFLAALGHHE